MNREPHIGDKFSITKKLISAEEFGGLDPAKYIIQRKYDGSIVKASFGGGETGMPKVNIFAECVVAKSGLLYTSLDRTLLANWGKFYVPLTLLSVNGLEVCGEPYEWCYQELNRLCTQAMVKKVTKNLVLCETPLATVAGAHESFYGEGLVAHPKDAPWGSMLCWKRTEIYICRVTHLWGGKSVEVEETQDSLYQRRARSETPKAIYQAISRVAITAVAADQLRLGSIIRVEGLCQTENHSIREGKLCTNWLVKI